MWEELLGSRAGNHGLTDLSDLVECHGVECHGVECDFVEGLTVSRTVGSSIEAAVFYATSRESMSTVALRTPMGPARP
jgi:hypothetical protein